MSNATYYLILSLLSFSSFFFSSSSAHRDLHSFPTRRSSDLISGRLATKSNQIKQLIRNGRIASLQRTFKKSFTSFSHKIGRAVQQECRDRSRMPSSA